MLLSIAIVAFAESRSQATKRANRNRKG